MAHSARVLVLKHAEVARVGYGLFDLYRAHVVLGAALHIDLRLRRDLLGHLRIRKVVPTDYLRTFTLSYFNIFLIRSFYFSVSKAL